ncbi:armadillo-type fold protein [Tanacetum coccineum]
MTNTDVELEQQLKEVGKKLLHPPDAVDELLPVLDQVERLLSKVDQSPKKTMLDALKPSMKALIQDDLLRHSDVDVKVAAASCISEITRITAPDAPYDDDQMRDVFQLIVSSFEDLADQSSRSYIRRASILETVSKVRSCVIMLDLECDEMIVEMFEHFLRSLRDYHRGVIYSSMENIMILALEESEDISVNVTGNEEAIQLFMNPQSRPLHKGDEDEKSSNFPMQLSFKEGCLTGSSKRKQVTQQDEIDTENAASPSKSETPLDESRSKKAGRSKNKDLDQEENTPLVDVKAPEISSDSDVKPQKRAGKMAVVAKKVKSPATIDSSEDDEAASDSDKEPPLKISKKLEPVNSGRKSKQWGKKAVVTKEVKLPDTIDSSEDDEAASDSDEEPPLKVSEKLEPVNSEDEERCWASSDERIFSLPKKLVKKLEPVYFRVSKPITTGGKESGAAGRPQMRSKQSSLLRSQMQRRQTGKTSKQSAKKEEDSVSDSGPLKSVKKVEKRKRTVEEEDSDSDAKPLKLSAKKGNASTSGDVKSSSKKKDDGRKRASGKNVIKKAEAKTLSSDDEMDVSPKSAKKPAKGEGTLSYIRHHVPKRKKRLHQDEIAEFESEEAFPEVHKKKKSKDTDPGPPRLSQGKTI